MPIYNLQAPDGRKFRVEAPDGATEAEVLAYAEANYPQSQHAAQGAGGSGSKLQQFRSKYPQYDQLPDDQLADAMHRKFYGDMPREDFDQRLRASNGPSTQYQQGGSKFGGIPVEQGSKFGGVPMDPREELTALRRMAELEAKQASPDFSNVRGGAQTFQRQRKPVAYSGPMLAPSTLAQGQPPAESLEAVNARNRATRSAPGFAADQKRATAGNRQAEFQKLPAPTRFAIGMGQRVAAAGRGAGQLYAQGADAVFGGDRYGAAMQREQESRQRESFLQGDTAAAIGGFAGDVGLTLAPAGLVARAGGVRALAGGAGIGGAYAGLQPVIQGESRMGNAKVGTAFGAGGQALGMGLSVAGRNAANAVPKDIRKLVSRAGELGIPVHASQVSQSLPVKVAASAGKYLPFSGYGKVAGAQQAAANRAVARTFGAEADKLTDDVMHGARRKLNAGFEEVYNRNAVPLTEQGARKLAQVENEASRRLTRDEAQVLRNQVDDILSNADDGVLTGQKYQAVRTALKKAEGNDKLGMAVREVRQALDDIAAEAVGLEDAAKLKALRSQWANFRTAENALKQNSGAGGDIRLGALWPLIRKGSTKEMRELARMGQTLLKDPISDSGTAQRSLAYNLLMGGGSLANPALIPLFAKAAFGGATVGRAANSPALAKLLARESRGVPTSQLGALLGETSPYVTPAMAQQYNRKPR